MRKSKFYDSMKRFIHQCFRRW